MSISKTLKQRKVWLHTLFWLVSITINAYFFKITTSINTLDFYYSAFAHISIIVGVYINIGVLLPLFFNRHKYTQFLLYQLVNGGIMTLLYSLTFDKLVDFIMPNYFFVSQFNVLETYLFSLTYLAFTTLLKLSESWFELQEKNKLILLTEKENISNQLKALKSQINPHFLFNSLNLIYSESLKKTEKVPEIVLKLSDILRYVIYKSKNDTIKISEEIELINNYILLQQYRSDDNCKISFTPHFELDHNIAPMLFLPLIENSFKHGLKGDLTDTYVQIELNSNNKSTQFMIKNNKSNVTNHLNIGEKGIGLPNVKKRLELLYPNRSHFVIKDENDSFTVDITLKHQS